MTEVNRPSYIPPNAPWCWVTDGLGRQVGAWAEVQRDGTLVVHVQGIANFWHPMTDYQWSQAWMGPESSAEVALQCRALYDRCVVDDKGRVWEMVWEQSPEADDDDDPVIAFGRSGDSLVPLDVLLRFITAPDQVAKVRAFIEAQCGPSEPVAIGEYSVSGLDAVYLAGKAATEADEQSSSVGINTTGECARCGKSHFRLGNFCSRECERLGPAKAARPMDEPEPPFAGTTFDLQAAAIARLELALSKAESERDTALARGDELGKSLHRFQHGEEIEGDYACESSLRQQKVIDDLRDELKVALARAEKAEFLLNESVARERRTSDRASASSTRLVRLHRELGGPWDGDFAAEIRRIKHRVDTAERERNEAQSLLDALLATLSKALPTTPISPKNAREALELVVRERNEAQARVRELEAELKEANDRASKWETSSLSEHERRKQTESQLASVTAQRDRLRATLENGKRIAAQIIGLNTDSNGERPTYLADVAAASADKVLTALETNPRPACVPDGVTEWTRLPSGLACWRDEERCCIEDARPFNENNPWIVDKENAYEAVYTASKDLSEEFTKAVTKTDFTSARHFMGWE
jgi:hypothetical protein